MGDNFHSSILPQKKKKNLKKTYERKRGKDPCIYNLNLIL